MSTIQSQDPFLPSKPQLQRHIYSSNSHGERLYFGSNVIGGESSNTPFCTSRRIQEHAKPGIRLATWYNKAGQWLCDKLGLKKRFVTKLTFTDVDQTGALKAVDYFVNTNSLKSFIVTISAAKDYFANFTVSHTESATSSPILPPRPVHYDQAYSAFLSKAQQISASDCPESVKLGALLSNLTYGSYVYHKSLATPQERQSNLLTGILNIDGRPATFTLERNSNARKREYSDYVYNNQINWSKLFDQVIEFNPDDAASLDSRVVEELQPVPRVETTGKSPIRATAEKAAKTSVSALTGAVGGFLVGGPIGAVAGAAAAALVGYGTFS